jgi:hypothetical protein
MGYGVARKERNSLTYSVIPAHIVIHYQMYHIAFSYIGLLWKYLSGNAMYYLYFHFGIYVSKIKYISIADIPYDFALHDMTN